MLCKIDTCSCKKAARKLGKTAVVKVGAYIVHVSIDRKTTVYRLEACEIALTENTC